VLLKLECIDGYRIVDKNKCDCVEECGMCWRKDVWEYTCDDIYIVGCFGIMITR
jgi:hypothetical protein